jgi:prevent-host-death family protein
MKSHKDSGPVITGKKAAARATTSSPLGSNKRKKVAVEPLTTGKTIAVFPSKKVAIAFAKANFSKLVREVQAGRSITLTQHGRPAAVLAPLPSTTPTPAMSVRPPLDTRPFGELLRSLQPLPDEARPTADDIRDAIDETRTDRF